MAAAPELQRRTVDRLTTSTCRSESGIARERTDTEAPTRGTKLTRRRVLSTLRLTQCAPKGDARSRTRAGPRQ